MNGRRIRPYVAPLLDSPRPAAMRDAIARHDRAARRRRIRAALAFVSLSLMFGAYAVAAFYKLTGGF